MNNIEGRQKGPFPQGQGFYGNPTKNIPLTIILFQSGDKILFSNSVQIPLRAWMLSTRAVFCDPAPVSPIAGSGSASMPVVLEAGSNLRPARCCWTVLLRGKCVPTTRTRCSVTFINGGSRGERGSARTPVSANFLMCKQFLSTFLCACAIYSVRILMHPPPCSASVHICHVHV